MTSPSQPYYESDRAIGEYLLFHFGSPMEQCAFDQGPVQALNYPERCVSQCLDTNRLRNSARALDLGCAVGRSTFELARHCQEVVGIDFSHQFIQCARQLQQSGSLNYRYVMEGDLTQEAIAQVDFEIDRHRVTFHQGDAMNVDRNLGSFDVVLMANLIDRLNNPKQCLQSLRELVLPGGQLIITSPYTWLDDYTPRDRWLGGFQQAGQPVSTLQGLKNHLEADFQLLQTLDLPFLIREHARKYQWSVAQASCWLRR